MKHIITYAPLIALLVVPKEFIPFIMLLIIAKNLFEKYRLYFRNKNVLQIEEIMLKEDFEDENEVLQLKAEQIGFTFIAFFTNALCLIYLLFLVTVLAFPREKTMVMQIMISLAMLPYIKKSVEDFALATRPNLAFMKGGVIVKKLGRYSDYKEKKEEGKIGEPIKKKLYTHADTMLLLIKVDGQDIETQCDLETYKELRVRDEVVLLLKYK